MNDKKKIAIITGASAGLGVEYARQIEKSYSVDELWLIARRREPMEKLAQELKTKCKIFSLDLSKREERQKIKQLLETENPSIKILVNNAGYGKTGRFTEIPLEQQLNMIELNSVAPAEITFLCLPYMSEGSGILQIASSIAYSPAPFFAMYSATKAFLYNLSLALSFELKPRGIHVIAVCPGPVATEFVAVAYGEGYEPGHGQLFASAQNVVRKSLRDFDKKKLISIYGFAIRLFAFIAPRLPKFLLLRLAAGFRNQ